MGTSIEGLIHVLDSLELPEREITDIFINAIKTTPAADISSIFFHDVAVCDIPTWLTENDADTIADVAIPLVAWNIGQIADFESAVDTQRAGATWKSIIAGQKGAEMSKSMIYHWLMKKPELTPYLTNKDYWATEIANYLGHLVQSKEISYDNGLFLKFLALKMLSTSTYCSTINEIQLYMYRHDDKEHSLSMITEYVEKKNFLLPSLDILEDGFLLEIITNVCRYGKAGPRLVGQCSAVLGWLNRTDGPSTYCLNSIGKMNMMNYVPRVHSGGCVLGNTSILMETGEYLDIEHINESDVILGDAGEPGLVSHENVVYSVDNHTLIYGINEETPFFTADHPFWTQDGWRAIDPVTAKEDNNWLKVGQLSLNDRVCKVKSHDTETSKVKYEWVEIINFSKTAIEPGTNVHGIHLREGPRSCHANGYLVHLNYPEITKARLSNLPDHFREESTSVFKHMIQPISKQVDLFNYDEFPTNLASSSAFNAIKPLSAHPDGCVPLEEVTLLNTRLIYNINVPRPSRKYQKLSVIRGHLFFDDRHMTTSKRISHDQITWSQQLADGTTENGVVCFYPDRLSGYGKIIFESKTDSAEEVSIYFMFINQLLEFNCQKTTMTLKDLHCDDSIKQIGHDVQHFGTISFGREIHDNNKQTIFNLQTPDVVLSSVDLHDNVVFGIDTNNQLNFTVFFPADYQPIVGYTRLFGTLTWNYQSFEGEIIPFDASKPGNEGDALLFMGVANRSKDYDRKLNDVREYALRNIKSHPLLSRSTLAINKRSISSKLTQLADSVYAEHASLEDLSTIEAPAPEILHTLTFNATKEAMVYSMPDERRQNIFGKWKLKTENFQSIEYDKHNKFLEKVFANAFIGMGLVWNKQFGNKLLDDESKNKLLYFWNGKGEKCLSEIKDYSVLVYSSALQAFTCLTPNIKKYVKETPSKRWAKILFENLTMLHNLQSLTLSVSTPLSTSVLQKYCMLFEVLEPGSTYSVNLCERVLARQIYLMSYLYKGSEEDRKSMYSFVYDAVKSLVLQILSNKGFLGMNLLIQLQPLLTESMVELHVNMEKNPEMTIKKFMIEAELVLAQIVNIWKETSGSFWQRISNGICKWSSEYSTNHKTGKLLACLWPIAIAGYGLYASIKEMTWWNEPSQSQSAGVVELLLKHVVSILTTIPKVTEAFSNIFEGFYSINFAKRWTSAKHTVNDLQLITDVLEKQSLQEDQEQSFILRVAKEVGSSTANTKLENVKTARWQALFNVTDSMARVNTTIALSTSTVCLGFDILKSFQNDIAVPQHLLHTASNLIIGMETIAKVLKIPLESLHLPLIGTILAESGITLAIAAVDIHASQLPINRATARQFLQDELRPFLSKLMNPPKSWIEEYKKKHEKKKPELTEEEKLIKTLLESHLRRMNNTKSNDEGSVPC